MTIIDTHTHLYLKEFATDIDEVLKNATNRGVKKFYLPNINSSTINDVLKLANKYPSQCIPMMGLHPCYVNENATEELQQIFYWLQKYSFAAIGEIGLDFYWDKSFAQVQKEVFEKQINWAIDFNLPIVIHSRNATQDCIDIVKQYQNGSLRGIFHCFGGSLGEAKQIMDLGFFLGIGGVVTYKKTSLIEVLPHIPLDCIVLETDAPYLPPVPFRGKRNEPAYLKYIVEKLSEIMQLPIETIAEQTTSNAQKIFPF